MLVGGVCVVDTDAQTLSAQSGAQLLLARQDRCAGFPLNW